MMMAMYFELTNCRSSVDGCPSKLMTLQYNALKGSRKLGFCFPSVSTRMKVPTATSPIMPMTEKISSWPAFAKVLAHLLPVTDAAISLKYVLVKNQMLEVTNAAGETVLQHASVYSRPSFFFLIVGCALWTTIGISCFKLMENWSRNKGTLGAY